MLTEEKEALFLLPTSASETGTFLWFPLKSIKSLNPFARVSRIIQPARPAAPHQAANLRPLPRCHRLQPPHKHPCMQMQLKQASAPSSSPFSRKECQQAGLFRFDCV